MRKRIKKPPRVSVVVPARNEAGNVEISFHAFQKWAVVLRSFLLRGIPVINTFEVIQQGIAKHPEKQCLSMQQTGKGKGDAVRLGFSKASGDVLMILDADLTVPPEDLPRFYDALISGKGDFINGVRLVYPMKKKPCVSSTDRKQILQSGILVAAQSTGQRYTLWNKSIMEKGLRANCIKPPRIW